ncbi:MAG TPA: DNA polymerase I [Candidatus Eremiobacteraceae bacterium]
MSERKLLLLDVYALVYRAFFALPPLTTSSGAAVNAVYGFERMLARALASEKPSHAVACFDAGIPAERLAAMPTYKAQRPDMPNELRSQFPLVRKVLAAYGVAAVEVESEEADDCIATLATRASSQAFASVIVSGDLDLLQLVDQHCTVLTPKRGFSDLMRYDEAAVFERYGLRPSQLADYRGLKGDPSDNLSGVPGIGEKTAVKLIAQFGTLEEVLAHAREVKPDRIGALLVEHADLARRCRDVSLAKRTLPIALTWDECAYREPERERLAAMYNEFEFRGLFSRNEGRGDPKPEEVLGTSATATARAMPDRGRPQPKFRHILAATPADARDLLSRAMAQPEIALAAIGAPGAPPVAFAFAWPGSDAVVAPAPALLDDEKAHADFKNLLTADVPSKIVFGAKELARFGGRNGIVPRGVRFDLTLAYALLDPDRANTDLAGVAAAYGAPPVMPYDATAAPMELFGAGHGVSAEHASAAAAIATVAEPLQDDLANAGMSGVFNDIEMPLAAVLAHMEQAGFRLDIGELDRIRRKLDDAIAQATSAVHRLAGEEFNINSPKALGAILFEKLQMPGGSKKKTAWATGVEVLAPLASEHEIAARVLEYREVSKLKSTYVDALPALIDKRDGILHTTLNQLGAATGRLSSTNPNLQNIPVRSELGREIRLAFLPPTQGRVLLAADYSQIELRLFAHMSEDPTLIDAFKSGEDIHAYTARAVFAVPAGEPVPGELRRRAKAVNFGILYGMGSFGLAQSVGFSRGEARDFIAAYFARFPQIKQYIAGAIDKARVDGQVTTLLGRRRLLPDLKSPNHAMRAAAERVAINAPLQGSAADLIKLAMVRIARRIEEQRHPAQLLLQVHDELIFEVDMQALDALREDVRNAMENAMTLRVPLVVDFKSGPSWGDMA